jgi:hypothetical protein
MTAEKFNLDPKQTTSIEYHEQLKEEREELGCYYGERVGVVAGSKPPSGLKPANPPVCPAPTSKAALSPVDRPYRPAMRVSEVEDPIPCEVITLIKHTKGKRK